MIIFYLIAALLSLLVFAWVVRPWLFPQSHQPSLVSDQRLNADIYRDQLEALARDLAQGLISPADYAAAEDELKLRLLDDTQAAPPAPTARAAALRGATWRSAAVLGLLFVLSGFGLYAWLGAPWVVERASAQKAEADKILGMVNQLAQKLQAQPNDPQGWAMLARSYKVLGRFAEAKAAYAQAAPALNADPDLLTDYADLLATEANGQLAGQPLALVNQALALSPLHPVARMMAGVAAYQQGDYAQAANHWEKLLPLLQPESPAAVQLQNDIAQARAKSGGLAAPPP